LAGSKKNVDSLCSTWLAWDANSPEAAVVIAGNFSEDVTVNGSINSSDVALVQSKSGTALP
jgi:hypothetical protein